MNPQNLNPIAATLASFIGMGVFIVLLIVGLVFFSYLLIIGGVIGLILLGILYLRAKFFAPKKKNSKNPKAAPSTKSKFKASYRINSSAGL